MTDALRQQLQESLGSAYTLERELGGGGMSRVFVARDVALERDVVVKVLAPELAEGVSAERFTREIRLAAALQEPHIVPVLAAGTAGDGLPWYTMPFVRGDSLRRRLADGPVALGDALDVLRDVATALEYAHARGVVHRDVKPENVMLSGRTAVVLDFGIAKALSASRTESTRPPADGPLTVVGTSIGTPAYMAPEQAAGDPEVDQRADLYSWGVVAYEVLAGAHPFAAARSPQALFVARLTELPRPLEQLRRDVPPALAALIMGCLAKDPSDRPSNARTVVEALGALASARGLALGDALGDASAASRTVAVFPMANTSGDPEAEHFSDGLTDELIGALSKVQALRVTGRTSSFALKGKGLDVRAVAALLGVDAVLEGSVRRAGSRLKVSVQLVNAEGSVRWAERYDRTLTDVFEVQEEIAQAVVRALELHLAAGQERLVHPGTANLAAYDLYLKGKFALRRLGPDDLRRAIGYFEQAIATDDGFAAAYAWLCNAHVLAVLFGGRPVGETMQRASAYATRAVALSRDLADAHWMRALVAFVWDVDWAGAEQAVERALVIEPGHGDARHLHAIYLLARRRSADARAELTRALAADPLLADAHMTMGRLCLSVGEPDEAIDHLREALQISPEFSFARGYLGHAYLMKDATGAAVAEFERAAASGLPVDRAQLAYACARVGRKDDAATLLGALLAPGRDSYPPPFHIAMAYVGLGDVDEAFRWLERAYAERVPFLIGQLAVEPAFVPLHPDARFASLLRRLGLAS